MIDRMKQHGAFSWNELITNDLAAAKAFYTRLFGWELEEVQPGEIPYTMVRAGGEEVAGMMATPPEAGPMPPAWGAYVTVDDVDESAKLAQELGGRVVMEPREIPGVGRFCVIVDPQGAALSMITYLDKPM